MDSNEFNKSERPKDPKASGGANASGVQSDTGVAISALSRVLAVLVLGAAVAGIGALLDSWLGTKYWMLIGIISGTLLAIPGLFLVVKVSELDAKRLAKERLGSKTTQEASEPKHAD